MGRTPLYIAAKHEFLRPVKALLAGGAKPQIKTGTNVSSLDTCKNGQILGFLKKGFLLQLTMPMIRNKQKRQEVWEIEGLIYFDNNDDNLCVDDFPED